MREVNCPMPEQEEKDQATQLLSLHSQVNMYKGFLEKLPLGVSILKLEIPGDPGSLRIIARNSTAERITGLSNIKALGKTIREYFPKFLETEGADLFMKALQTQTLQHIGELRYGDENVKEGTFSVNAIPIGSLLLAVVYEDITERKQAMAELIQSEKMASLGTMGAGLAHELFNPMTGMLNFTRYCLKHTSPDDKRYSVLQDTLRGVERCISIARDMLTFSHIERR